MRIRLCILGAAAASSVSALAVARADAPSVFSPQSPPAHSITTLAWIVFGLGALVALGVWAGLGLVVVRYRRREGQGEPRQIAGNRTVEIVWTAIPVVIVIVLFVLALRTQSSVISAPSDALRVEVIGHDWWWEYRYPDANVVTANELVVPQGRPVKLDITSADVIHSFWVPELNGKIDAVPGKHNELWFKAEQARVYLGQCAEFCGLEHSDMLLRVDARAPQAFDQWLNTQKQAAAQPSGGDAATGAQIFLARTCSNCHGINGTAAAAQVGPDLTHFGSRQTLAAGVLPNTTPNLESWLADPNTVKPGVLMPNLKLSADEIRDLAAYLEGLK